MHVFLFVASTTGAVKRGLSALVRDTLVRDKEKPVREGDDEAVKGVGDEEFRKVPLFPPTQRGGT
jgi:hypothetical protein